MTRRSVHRLLRECAALIAVLALALGPLALHVERSLGLPKQIAALAAGGSPALCLPGGGDGGTTDPPCDHCLPLKAMAPPAAAPSLIAVARAAAQAPTATPLRLAGFPRAPPARGPPPA